MLRAADADPWEDVIKDQNNSKLSAWLKLAMFVIPAASIAYLVYQSGMFDFFMSKTRMLKFIDSLGSWAPFGLILLQALQVVIAPIPGEATNVIGGFLFGPILGTLLSTVGVTIGSYIAFILARTFGRPFVEKYVSKSIMKRFDYLLHHKGAFVVFLIFLVPGTPKDSLCYILGLGHLTSLEFLVISGVGRLFGTVIETLGGNFLRHEQYKLLFFLLGITLILILFMMVNKQKIERLFRAWHITDYKKKKQKKRRDIQKPTRD